MSVKGKVLEPVIGAALGFGYDTANNKGKLQWDGDTGKRVLSGAALGTLLGRTVAAGRSLQINPLPKNIRSKVYRGFSPDDGVGSISRIRQNALKDEYLEGALSRTPNSPNLSSDNRVNIYNSTSDLARFGYGSKIQAPIKDTFLGMDFRNKFTPAFRNDMREFRRAAGSPAKNTKDFKTAFRAGYKGADNPFDAVAVAKPSVSNFPTLGLKFSGGKLVDAKGSSLTKAQAKSYYKNIVKKNHPDIGGDNAKFTKITQELSDLTNNPNFTKLARILVFGRRDLKNLTREASERVLKHTVEDPSGTYNKYNELRSSNNSNRQNNK